MEEISVSELAAKREQTPEDVELIDVREDEEWQAGHVPGARHIPLSQFMEREGELPEAERVYVMCHAGGRSARVVQYLEQTGRGAVNVTGGIASWQESGYPVTDATS